MPLSRPPRLLCAALLILSLGGCVPSDAQIANELADSRREAYLEWKTKRERGESSEVRMNGPLSLEDAVKVSLQYNKELQGALQNREIARGNRISEYALILPSLEVSGGAGHLQGASGSYLTTYSTGFSVSQNIFDAQIPPRLRSARLNSALTDEGIRASVQNLIASVANTYYDVLLAQRMVETQREALISAETQYRMVSEKKKQETATDYDVLRAQVDVATYRAGMQNEINNVDTNRVALLKLMGASQDSEITFSDRLEFLPMRPVFERAVEIASGNRPDLRQAEITYRLEQEAVLISKSAFFPALGASFSQNWSKANAAGSFGRNPWQAGLSASVDLGINNYGSLVTAKAKAKQAQIGILDTQENVVKEIRQYMNSLANAEETVKALVVNQGAAREALRLVLVGYQAGVRTEVDVTDARKALTDVMGQYYTALANHTKARLNLQLAMGVLGPSTVSDGMPEPPRVPIANITEFAATDYVPPEPPAIPTSTYNMAPPASPEPISAVPAARPVPVRSEPPVSVVSSPVPPLSARDMPPPPGAASVRAVERQPASPPAAPAPLVQAPAPQQQRIQAPAPGVAEAAPAAPPTPVENRAQPLFRVSVREGAAGS